MKTSKTYILRSRAHLSQTIIEIRDNLVTGPLSEKQHEILDRLEEITDLHFCFLEYDSKKIDFEMFAEAYRATSYSVSSDGTGISGIMEAIRYDRTMYPGQHVLWFVAKLDGFDQPKTIKKIIESSEVLKKSIYEVHRLDSEFLWMHYQKNREKSLRFWQKPDRTCVYSTHEVPIDQSEPVIVLRGPMIDLIYKYDQENPGYTETFPWFTQFLGSITDRAPGAYDLLLKQNPRDVKINSNRP